MTEYELIRFRVRPRLVCEITKVRLVPGRGGTTIIDDFLRCVVPRIIWCDTILISKPVGIATSFIITIVLLCWCLVVLII